VLSLTYMAGNFTRPLVGRLGVDTMIRAGVAVTVAGAAIGATWVLLAPHGGPAVVFIPQMIIGFASGFMLRTRSRRGQRAPAGGRQAAGVSGFMQMGLGAATSQLIGHLLAGAETALPLAVVVLVLCACGLVAFFGLIRK